MTRKNQPSPDQTSLFENPYFEPKIVEKTDEVSFSNRFLSQNDLEVVGKPGSQCRQAFEFLLQHGHVTHAMAEAHLNYMTVIRTVASKLKRRLPRIGYELVSVPEEHRRVVDGKERVFHHAVYHLRKQLTDEQRFRRRCGVGTAP